MMMVMMIMTQVVVVVFDNECNILDQWKTELNIPRPERIVRASLMQTMLGGSTLWVKIMMIIWMSWKSSPSFHNHHHLDHLDHLDHLNHLDYLDDLDDNQNLSLWYQIVTPLSPDVTTANIQNTAMATKTVRSARWWPSDHQSDKVATVMGYLDPVLITGSPLLSGQG